jgi:hypothetical protein
MWQVDGMKERELTRGDLADMSWIFFFRDDNPYREVWLNSQKSAEAIVPAGSKQMGRAEHQEVSREHDSLEGLATTADNFI